MRNSVIALDMTDLYMIESLVYSLLKNILRSQPGGKLLSEFTGGIRLHASVSKHASVKSVRFDIDFPDKFTLYHPVIPDVIAAGTRNPPEGASAMDFANTVGVRLAQLLLISPLQLHQGSSATSGSESMVRWYRLPDETDELPFPGI